jgi:hypothetical protein
MDDMDLVEIRSESDDYKFFIDDSLRLVVIKRKTLDSSRIAYIDSTRKVERSSDRLKAYSVPIIYGDKTTGRITVAYACMNIIRMHTSWPRNHVK